jgi:hypothetical protein
MFYIHTFLYALQDTFTFVCQVGLCVTSFTPILTDKKFVSYLRTELFCSVLGYYTASSGNSLPMFRDNLSAPSSRFKVPLEIGPLSCPETSVRNYYYSLINSPEENSSHLLGGGRLRSPIYNPLRSR